MPMNKGLQKHQLEKQLKEQGITDFDTEAHIDPQLTLKENLDKLEDELGLKLRKDDPGKREVNRRDRRAILGQAKSINEQRSAQARLVDGHKKADTVFEQPVSDEEFEKWAENPDEYDMEGVDDEPSMKILENDSIF